IAPEIKPYLDLWPLPNGASTGGGSGERFTPGDTISDENYMVVRGDYRINDNQLLFARFNYDNAENRAPTSLGILDDVTPSRQRFSTLQYENILTPALLWNSSFSFNRTSLNHVIDYKIDYPRSLFFLGKDFAPSF